MSVQITTTTPGVLGAVERLAGIISKMYPCNAFQAMTCEEAEAFAQVLREAGYAPEADIIIEQHAESDDEPTDEHYDGYLRYLHDLGQQI